MYTIHKLIENINILLSFNISSGRINRQYDTQNKFNIKKITKNFLVI